MYGLVPLVNTFGFFFSIFIQSQIGIIETVCYAILSAYMFWSSSDIQITENIDYHCISRKMFKEI